jgi:hypothetical protein
MSFKVNGSDRLKITSTGNVGIGLGSASPLRRLHIKSGAGTMQVESTGTSSTIYLADTTSSSLDNQGIGSAGNDINLIAGGYPRLKITSTGNVGIGVTPESWPTNGDFRALQIGSGAAVYGRNTGDESKSGLTANAYVDGVNDRWQYISGTYASNYYQADGSHIFYVAPSGIADAAITWTTAMTITNTGNVEINGNLDVTNNFTPASKINIGSGSYFIGNASQGYRFNNAADTLNLVTMYDGGDVRVHHGNLIIGTAGKGIDFSAQASTTATGASATSGGEVLDSYEEGTWTPTILAYSGTNPTVSGTLSGQYTRIGDRVTLSFEGANINISGVTSGMFVFGGAPFAINDGKSAGHLISHAMTFARADSGGLAQLGTKIGLLTVTNGGSWSWEGLDTFGTNVSIRASFTYKT